VRGLVLTSNKSKCSVGINQTTAMFDFRLLPQLMFARSHTLDRRTGTICTWRNSLSCPHPESIASYHNFRAHHNLNNMRQCHGFHVSFIDGRLVSSHGVMDSIREYYVFCFLIFYMEICLLSTGTDAYRDSV
jgi:hypothetical protein